MAWLTVITVCAVGIALAAILRLQYIKKEVYFFEDKVEQELDAILLGEERIHEEDTEDTLWGKTGEKLQRVAHVWKKKEEQSAADKEKMKGLISDISHQTRTPIANMKLYQEFLQEEPLTDRGHEFLRSLQTQTEKLDFLLQNMVKMSRLETGIICIKGRSANLYDTIGGAVGGIVPAASKKQIALYVECDNPVEICHDVKWTEEAIFNILDNAVKYSNFGGEIHVSVVRQEFFTRIQIQDRGKGIAPERQAQIFTRFYREPEVHDLPGVGIGLYLARRIMELQNGYIEVRSEEGAGASFHLYLPN